MNTSRIACASSSSTPSNSAKAKKFSTSSDDKNASEQSICKQRVRIPSFSVASTCLAASSKCSVSSSPDIFSVAAMAASKSCVRVLASKRSPMSATSDCSNSQYSPSAQTAAARNDTNALEFVFMIVVIIVNGLLFDNKFGTAVFWCHWVVCVLQLRATHARI